MINSTPSLKRTREVVTIAIHSTLYILLNVATVYITATNWILQHDEIPVVYYHEILYLSDFMFLMQVVAGIKGELILSRLDSKNLVILFVMAWSFWLNVHTSNYYRFTSAYTRVPSLVAAWWNFKKVINFL